MIAYATLIVFVTYINIYLAEFYLEFILWVTLSVGYQGMSNMYINKSDKRMIIYGSSFTGFVYLFNGISTPSGIFSTEIWFMCKGLFQFICLKAYEILTGYLVTKFD